MFKKIFVKINSKKFFFKEISVLEYWTMLEDYELFLEEYFSKYDLDYKKISKEKLEKILENILSLWQEKNVLSLNLENKKSEKIENAISDFHIIIWKFMYIFHISYADVVSMPFSVFMKMSEDLLVIVWEKEKKEKVDFSWKPEKEKLKELFW